MSRCNKKDNGKSAPPVARGTAPLVQHIIITTHTTYLEFVVDCLLFLRRSTGALGGEISREFEQLLFAELFLGSTTKNELMGHLELLALHLGCLDGLAGRRDVLQLGTAAVQVRASLCLCRGRRLKVLGLEHRDSLALALGSGREPEGIDLQPLGSPLALALLVGSTGGRRGGVAVVFEFHRGGGGDSSSGGSGSCIGGNGLLRLWLGRFDLHD